METWDRRQKKKTNYEYHYFIVLLPVFVCVGLITWAGHVSNIQFFWSVSGKTDLPDPRNIQSNLNSPTKKEHLTDKYSLS